MIVNDDGAQCTLSLFVGDTKLGRVADKPEGSAAIQKDLNRLEKMADGNLTQFSRGKYKGLHLERNNLLSICWD